MKNRRVLKTAALLIAVIGCLALLAGCGGTFGIVMNEDLQVEITAENASEDSSGSVGVFTVADKETAVIEPDLTEGKILVQFIAAEGGSDKDADILEDIEGEPAFEIEVSGTDAVPCKLPAGDYMVTATVIEKANGTAVIHATKEESGESILEGSNLSDLMQQVADSEISKSYEEYLPDEALANAEVFGEEDGKVYAYLNTQEFVILDGKAYSMSGGSGEAIISYTRSDDGIKLENVEWSADGGNHDQWIEENFPEPYLSKWKSYESHDENGFLKLDTKMIAKAEEKLGVPVERENLLTIDTEKGTYKIEKTIETGTPGEDDYSFDTETVKEGKLEKK